ncbi:hypothetical protein DCAR_0832719 [Daucus carota subsp. sativus]|uniref:Cytochrome P450 n=1 Tax=Daucus carota subsp. sativus TaxID=79200 RepID=A0AAF0XSK7_DAUCS|nr:PREDICTED: cytochrome P450 76A1-like [Daucus carota subsp. sativus]WOH13210.1 hypothetical protein DCAR_0832719 [Daucus carota subsp. sativus]
MESIWTYIFWSILMSLAAILWHLRSSGHNAKLPPGPRGWPIFGNVFDLGNLPHRSLAALKPQYGPVVWTNLGSVKTMTVLSAAAAEELFKNHDLSFINRTIVETMRSHDFGKCSTGSVPYGDYWRTLRRICAVELFTAKKLNETKVIRQKWVDKMVLWIEKEIKERGSAGFELTDYVFPALYNMMGNILISRDLVDPHSKIASEFYIAMAGFLECMGRPNVSDIFPWLRWLDLQGLRKRMDRDLGKTIEITSGFVEDRVRQRRKKEGDLSESKDFLDVLLNSKDTESDERVKLSDHQITIFLLEMFFGGTETFSATIEWAMSELLQNPEAMIKIKSELSRVLGNHKKLEDSDIDDLPYLQATVEETLRLHPPLPLLIPRKAIRETTFMGYSIPKNTQVLVNAWAIGRDEERWEDALSFKPERFLGSDVGYKGQNFEFIPFGAGRRICPGIPLAHRLLPLILGSLLHHFDWEACKNVHSEVVAIDMMETMGTTAKKLEHLIVVATRSL